MCDTQVNWKAEKYSDVYICNYYIAGALLSLGRSVSTQLTSRFFGGLGAEDINIAVVLTPSSWEGPEADCDK